MNDKITPLLMWFCISAAAGMVFNVGWSIVFWNNDALYMWHWLGVFLAVLMMAVGAITIWGDDRDFDN